MPDPLPAILAEHKRVNLGWLVAVDTQGDDAPDTNALWYSFVNARWFWFQDWLPPE